MTDPWVRRVQIGDCVLYQGDCLQVMPALGKVDAVVDNFNAVVFNQPYEKPAKRQYRAPARSDESLDASSPRDHGPVCERDQIAGSNGQTLRGDAGGLPKGAEATRPAVEVEGKGGGAEWALQGRDAKHGIQADDRKGSLQPLRRDAMAGDSSSGRGAYEQHAGQSGSSLLALPFQPSQAGMVGLPKGWAVLTDPPYGIDITKSNRLSVSRGFGGKAWDCQAPDLSWLVLSGLPAIVWGGNYFGLPAHRGPLVWDKNNAGRDFADFEMAWTNLDMVARRFVMRPMGMDGGKLHPTQKPIALMEWCLGFLPNAETILDPFMGSGTTGVACVNQGRKFIGIEMDPDYFDICVKRITDAHRQADLFVAKPATFQPSQEALDL